MVRIPERFKVSGDAPVAPADRERMLLLHHRGNLLDVRIQEIKTQEESLLILNKDIRNRQTFSAARIHDLVQAGAPLTDISPGDRLDYIPEPFSYELAPGQGIVLITTRDAVPED